MNGKVTVLQKNGSIIPYMDGEEVLFWWRVKRLQKMIRIEKWRKRFTEMHMWTQKLVELSKNIDKRRYTHGR
jgi:hypothetical protein